ncbi:hypothetical protein HMPREF1531_02283 [Propionibacterium sp. oral taxon 192 str. F0372]|uniref:class I SAM-dependent methyltransferase n=1 Tax=Propionibacterium sp. oral taxon 192 TaxID=671222 RepID=UPI00035448D7|nr:class I SAM-dependent methyltransferase [Propionibacterium sp. oral taxon 192]EPH02965.1 hypothetical protein HMPREF1531_02283 [Propionibacterium sp. oral taxon 192 str. F0372]
MTEEENTATGPRTAEEHRAPGHWLLARMGKKVLRPGGIELTRRMLSRLAPQSQDRIVELGPGIGRTAQILVSGPHASYTGIEPNPEAREQIRSILAGHHNAIVVEGDAQTTGQPDDSATVLVSEAMLTMQSEQDKAAIAAEVFRVLAPGGRWGIHEMSLRPDDVDPKVATDVSKALSRTIKVGARPLTTAGWTKVFTDAGFEIDWVDHNDMRLVEPSRIIADEGLIGALKFFNNVRRNPAARERILAMRKVFRTHQDHIAAVAMVLRKPNSIQEDK